MEGRGGPDGGHEAVWVTLPNIGPPSSRPVAASADGISVLVCSVRGTLYAYRDSCASCGSSMAAGHLDREVLTCPGCGTQYNVRLAGIAVAAAVLALDITSKPRRGQAVADRQIRLLGGFLTLRESRNPGAAFSLGTSLTFLYSAIAITVIVVILRTSRRIRSVPWAITLGLLLGGATGNLIDRIFRYPGLFRGWVVDWIQVPHWPVFNLADSAIVCGGILAVLLSARGVHLDGRREQK